MSEAIVLRGVTKRFNGNRRRRRSVARPSRPLDLRIHRPPSLRQDADAQDDHAHPAAGPGRDRGAGIARHPPPARHRVSYLPEERGLYKKMTIRRLLRYYARLKGGTRAAIDAAIEEWMRRLELPGDRRPADRHALEGMSQKVQFVAAVVSNPSLLILDEPFSGLDPVNAQVLKDAVLEMRRRGTTVVFSTHDMSTAEKMCDRIFMIFRGRKVLDGSLESIQSQYGADTVRVRTSAGWRRWPGCRTWTAVNDFGQMQECRLRGTRRHFLARLTQRASSTTSSHAARRLQDHLRANCKP
jgi:ABC-2 type transport system ATP-binding protein